MLTRLDRLIRRLVTQRACLEWAIAAVVDLPGPVLEFGLGTGRSYDHLRIRCADRDVFAFDRVLVAHPDCLPPTDRLIMGEFALTVPAAAEHFCGRAAIVHADVGGHDARESEALAGDLVPFWAQALRPGGLLLCDQPVAHPHLAALPLPAGVPGEYHIARRRTDA